MFLFCFLFFVVVFGQNHSYHEFMNTNAHFGLMMSSASPAATARVKSASEERSLERLARLRRKLARAEARVKAASEVGDDADMLRAAVSARRARLVRREARLLATGVLSATSSAAVATAAASLNAAASALVAASRGDGAGHTGTSESSAPGPVSILLFYAYVVPPWTPAQRAAAAAFCHRELSSRGCAGRLRVALEGFNSTLSGSATALRGFSEALRGYAPDGVKHFTSVDFKFVDGLPANKAFRELKVMPVHELVTYGFGRGQAPAGAGSEHVSPAKWNELAATPGAVIIDVRNANETAIGRFAPPPGGAKMLDPRMRRSTEFPDWVDRHLPDLAAAPKVLMYCTAGIRCERASALLRQRGLDNVVQLEGGIHRYLDAFPEDGGIWAGLNYVFDKRYAHGAARHDIVSTCGLCDKPWARYQAGAKCATCKMEALLCRDCERAGKSGTKPSKPLLCWLCAENSRRAREGGAAAAAESRAAAARAAAFAATGGGFDGEGSGR